MSTVKTHNKKGHRTKGNDKCYNQIKKICKRLKLHFVETSEVKLEEEHLSIAQLAEHSTDNRKTLGQHQLERPI